MLVIRSSGKCWHLFLVVPCFRLLDCILLIFDWVLAWLPETNCVIQSSVQFCTHAAHTVCTTSIRAILRSEMQQRADTHPSRCLESCLNLNKLWSLSQTVGSWRRIRGFFAIHNDDDLRSSGV